MGEKTELGGARAAITQARNEIAAEKQAKAVVALKGKLRELDLAETAVANIKRDIADLEMKIEQGNL